MIGLMAWELPPRLAHCCHSFIACIALPQPAFLSARDHMEGSARSNLVSDELTKVSDFLEISFAIWNRFRSHTIKGRRPARTFLLQKRRSVVGEEWLLLHEKMLRKATGNPWTLRLQLRKRWDHNSRISCLHSWPIASYRSQSTISTSHKRWMAFAVCIQGKPNTWTLPWIRFSSRPLPTWSALTTNKPSGIWNL